MLQAIRNWRVPLMAVIFGLLLYSGLPSPAQAILADISSIQMLDTETGLVWLDLSESRNRSFNNIVQQFGSGGQYEGYRHASLEEVYRLFQSAGIPHINESSGPNYVPVSNLMDRLGGAFLFNTLNGWESNRGVTGTPGTDPAYGDSHVEALLGRNPWMGIAQAGHGLHPIQDEGENFSFGHWLVQSNSGSNPVPEPASLLLLASGVAGLSRWGRKKF